MPTQMPLVSATVICLNEQQRIGDCLEALAWCDEIVVVDSGSSDATCDIAESYSNTRLLRRRFDTYAQQKNFAASQCRNDWILAIDADEVVSTELKQEIQNLDFSRAAYRIRRRTFLGTHEIRHGNWNPDFITRLFHNRQCTWGGTNPHESIFTDGRVGTIRAPILHYSYDSRQQYIDRSRKYAMLLAEHLAERGKHSSRAAALMHGAGNFVKSYLLRRGFLDGSDGLFLAWHEACASHLKHVMLSELCLKQSEASA